MESGSALRRSRDGEMFLRDAGSAGIADGGRRVVAQAYTSLQDSSWEEALPHIQARPTEVM
jgi:hypothetical protein